MKHLLLVIIAVLCISIRVYAQNPITIQDTSATEKPVPIDTTKIIPEFPNAGIDFGSSLQTIIPPSPASQAYDKFINYNVSIENGIPSIEIPLYEVKVGGTIIPISIKYHASGIKYKQNPGEIGVGWVLEPGYRVSRTIYGRPDELTENPIIQDLNTFPTNQSRDYYLSRFVRKDESNLPFGGAELDGEYDHFTYSIPNATGSFLIENRVNRTIKEFSKSNLLFDYTTGNEYSINKFIIKDGNGVTYTTGPVENNLNSGYVPIPGSAWVVQNISDSYGNNATFSYVNAREVSNYSPTSLNVNSYVQTAECVLPAFANSLSNPPSPYNIQRLSQISTDELLITFHRQTFLDSIIIFNKNNVRIKKIVFNRGFNLIHTFLDSVSIFGSDNKNPQVYRLDYVNRDFTQNIDRFLPDYWNFNKSTTSAGQSVYPMFQYYSLTDFPTAPSSSVDLNFAGLTRMDRNPSSVSNGNPDAASFTLNKITYPSGGSTLYEYESHKYVGIRDDTGTQGSKYVGIRVKQVSSHDALQGTTLIKEYKYGNSQDGVGEIAAIDIANSVYFAQDLPTYACPDVQGGIHLRHSITYNTVPSAELSEFLNSCPVRYGKVTEYSRESLSNLNYSNGKVEYYFSKPIVDRWTGFTTNPSYMAFSGFGTNLAGFGTAIIQYSVEHPNYYIYEYNKWDKPTLLSKVVYKSFDNSYIKVSKVLNTYEDQSPTTLSGLKVRKSYLGGNDSYGSTTNYYAKGLNSIFDYSAYNITFANKILSASTTITYSGSDSLETKQRFFYNSDYQIAKTETWNSDGSLYTKTSKYPVDYGNITATDNISLGLKRLQTSHVLNPSIEEVTEYGATSKRLVDAVLKTFKTDKPLLDKVLSAESEAPITNFTHSFNNSGAFNSDTRYQERARFNSYDSKGNLLEQQKTLGAKEVFLWGYDSNYPVAKVIGSDLSTVQGFVNQSVLNSQATTDLAMRTELNKIRVGLVSSNAQVSTYTYQPLVGISSETDPTGKTLLYEYDRHGRLAAIKNSSGATRVSYCYNYAGQPEPCNAIAPTGNIAASNLILIASAGPALPVTLIGFKATKIEKTTLLNWTTTNEVNSDRFEIERSSNAKHWNRIGAVSAAGDEKGNKQYSFTDMYYGIVPAGEFLYRLKMVDADGQHAYSSIQSVSFDKNGDLILYPNPVTIGEKLTLQTDNYEKIKEIRILDSYGKVVLKSSSTRLLDTSKLSPGLYLVQVTFLDNSVSTQRIVKQ